MSHFIGLVINTPKYLENHDFEDALAPYDENQEVPEYVAETVDDYEKVRFLAYYAAGFDAEQELYEHLLAKGEIEPLDDEKLRKYGNERRFYGSIAYNHKVEFVALFKENHQDIFDKFEELYEEANGQDWNGHEWRKNIVTGEWERISTYNPKSKWDWWVTGGRWDESLLTKSGELVNECLLGELNFEPFKDNDYCKRKKKDIWGNLYRPLKKSVKWHLCADNPPFCLVVDGQWIEKGEMGWWGITTNEKPAEDWKEQVAQILAKLPADAEVTAVDFHI
jgi:hypothetical protein